MHSPFIFSPVRRSNRQTTAGRIGRMLQTWTTGESGQVSGKGAKDIDEYNKLHDSDSADGRNASYVDLVNSYYNLATDFYEWGWGQSFHFAEKLAGESFKASIARHEYYLAPKLGMKESDRVLDCGCGIGGPLCATARSNLAPLASAAARTHPREPCATAATSASSPARA